MELAALRKCGRLKELHLKGCYRVGDAGLAALGRLRSLTLLNLHECWQVTSMGVCGLSGVDFSSNDSSLILRTRSLVTLPIVRDPYSLHAALYTEREGSHQVRLSVCMLCKLMPSTSSDTVSRLSCHLRFGSKP